MDGRQNPTTDDSSDDDQTRSRRVRPTLHSQHIEQLEWAKQMLAQDDRWNEEISDSEAIRRIIIDYPRIWSQATQLRALVDAVTAHDSQVVERALQDVQSQMSQSPDLPAPSPDSGDSSGNAPDAARSPAPSDSPTSLQDLLEQRQQ